jgi:hypothetical protein
VLDTSNQPGLAGMLAPDGSVIDTTRQP